MTRKDNDAEVAWLRERAALVRERDAIRAMHDILERELRALVIRCDGADGVRSDGSNIDTLIAHAVLGDFTPEVDK